MSALRLFVYQSWLGYRGLFLWLTPWSFTSTVVVAPILNFLLLVYVAKGVSEESYRELVLNLPIYSASTVVLGGILQMFYYDREFRIVLVAPRSSLYCFWSKSTFHFPNGVLAIGVTLAVVFGLFDVSTAGVDWFELIVAVCVSCLSYICFAMALGVVVSVTEDWLTTLAVGNASMLLLTGMVIPRADLPWPIRYLTDILPNVNALKAYRLALDGAERAAINTFVAKEAMVCALFAVVASASFLFVGWLRRMSRLPL